MSTDTTQSTLKLKTEEVLRVPSKKTIDSSRDAPEAALRLLPKKQPEHVKPEGQWESPFDFFIACVGFNVGLGNLWRFPYLCYKNGGGAFLIPYMFSLAVPGIPIVLLESSLGQLIGVGVLGAWEICPLLKGVGYAMMVILFYESVFYMQLIAWSLYYFYQSLQTNLPWDNCKNSWNSEYCFREEGNGCAKLDEYRKFHPNTYLNITAENCMNPVEEYWIRNVLRRSDSMTDFSDFNYGTGLCLFLCWAFCCYTVFGGIKSSGYVIYVTALFPYVCLVILFFRGITLPGAIDGLYHFFIPDFDRLMDPNVWNEAATQVFYSYGICTGCWVALGSRNKFRYNMLRDAVTLSVLNCCTALFAGTIVFSIIGFLAHEEGKPVDTVVESGTGLAFVVYVEAALRLPFSPFWSALFFAMLICLGMGSVFVLIEGFSKASIDEFEIIKKNEKIFSLSFMLISVAIGMLFNFGSGVIWFELFNFYSASGFALLAVALFELITVYHIHDGEKYIAMCEDMMRFKIGTYWRISWYYIGPVLCVAIFAFSLVIYKPLSLDHFTYPTGGIILGWCLALSSMICVPIYAIYRLMISPGETFREKWKEALTTSPKVLSMIKARAEEAELSEKLRGGGGKDRRTTATTATTTTITESTDKQKN